MPSSQYTGVTTINSGLLRILRWADAGSASGLGLGSTGATPNAADIVINGGTLNFGNVLLNVRTNRLFTIGPAGATLDNSSNTVNTTSAWVIGQNSDGSSSGNIAFSDSNAPASLTLTHNAPAANQFGTGTLGAVLGDPGTGANVTSLTKSGAGTWILSAATTNPRQDLAVSGNINVTANFAINTIAYTVWASTNAGGGLPDGDSNNDGVQNGVAYFMNATGIATNPALNATTRTVTWTNGGNIPYSDYGNQFVVQTSDDLVTWTDVLLFDPQLTNTSGSVSYTFTGTAPHFVRLKVTPNPN